MNSIQECLSYLRDIDFDRETLQRAREELADVTERANAPYVSLSDVERAATLAWNEALEAAAMEMEESAKRCIPFRAFKEEQTYNDAARAARALKRPA